MCKHTGDANAMGVGKEQHDVVQATICITVGTVIDGQEYRTLRGSKFRSMHSTRHCPIGFAVTSFESFFETLETHKQGSRELRVHDYNSRTYAWRVQSDLS